MTGAAAGPGRPRVTFGVIVLNGEPFTTPLLRSLYPFAHEIIVVEGAAPGAVGVAGPDGHSSDGTLDSIRAFIAAEDPDGRVKLVTAEDEGHADGFWPGEKHEMSQAYAARATGDYLWQVDVDEFYLAGDMERVLEMLARDPSITAVTFKQTTFWGGLRWWVDGWYLRRGATYYHRLFKWGPGYRYTTHRPPTVVDAQGRDLRSLHWLSGEETAAQGLRLYHYSLLLPKQVLEKCDYYSHARWAKRAGALDWAHEAWLELGRPFRVHNMDGEPSWLERFRGPHPEQVVRLMEELRANPEGRYAVRRTDDIERLLRSPRYRAGRAWLKLRFRYDAPISAVTSRTDPIWKSVRRGARKLGRLPRRALRKLRRLARA